MPAEATQIRQNSGTPEGVPAATPLDAFRHFPAITFWYGISPLDLLQTPAWLRTLYYDDLDGLKAEMQLYRIEAASVPYMKEDQANQIIDAYDETADERRARAGGAVVQEDLSPAMAAARMGGIGLAMEFRNAAGERVNPETGEVIPDA